MIDALDGQDQDVIPVLDMQMVASAWQGDEPVHYGSRVTVNVEVGEDQFCTSVAGCGACMVNSTGVAQTTSQSTMSAALSDRSV